MISVALVEYLNGRAGLTALVASRFYPSIVPQPSGNSNFYPAVTYQLISGPNLHSLAGASGLAYPRYQITAWAQSPLAMEQVRDALVDALDGFPWTLSPSRAIAPYWGDVNVPCVIKLDERDAPQISPGLEPARVYGRQMDFQIWHAEPRPTFN